MTTMAMMMVIMVVVVVPPWPFQTEKGLRNVHQQLLERFTNSTYITEETETQSHPRLIKLLYYKLVPGTIFLVMAAQLFLLLAVFNYLQEANLPVGDVSVQLCWSQRCSLPSPFLLSSPFKLPCLSVDFPPGKQSGRCLYLWTLVCLV